MEILITKYPKIKEKIYLELEELFIGILAHFLYFKMTIRLQQNSLGF